MRQVLIIQARKISEVVNYSLLINAKFGAGIILKNKRKLNLLNNVQCIGRRSTNFPIQSKRGKKNHDCHWQGEYQRIHVRRLLRHKDICNSYVTELLQLCDGEETDGLPSQ